jgi:hypothetical protein
VCLDLMSGPGAKLVQTVHLSSVLPPDEAHQPSPSGLW